MPTHTNTYTQHTLLLDLSHCVAVSMVHNCLSQIQDPIAALCINIDQPICTYILLTTTTTVRVLNFVG